MGTKILIISNPDGDFGAINFEYYHGGIQAKEVIENQKDFEATDEQIDETGNWEFRVEELSETVKPETVQFFRQLVDYDDLKTRCYFHEDEYIEVN